MAEQTKQITPERRITFDSVINVLTSHSLRDFPREEWKEIPGFENYHLSNYGRLKSLSRRVEMPQGRFRMQPERIMRLFVTKSKNTYLNTESIHINCSLGKEGKKKRIALARLVYYLFVRPFDLEDYSLVVSYKDCNSLNVHYTNLELLSISEQKYKMFAKGRARSWRADHKQAVIQYTVSGTEIARFESIYAAEKATAIPSGSIYTTVSGKSYTAGGYHWRLADPALQSAKKEKEIETASNKEFNHSLWEKAGKPKIDKVLIPPYLNLSLEDMEGEQWADLAHYQGLYQVSNLGRVKKLAGWSSATRGKIWLPEQIMALRLNSGKTKDSEGQNGRYLSVNLTKNRQKKQISIARLVYCCFVAPFDLADRNLVVISQNSLLPSTNNLQLISVKQRKEREKARRLQEKVLADIF
ncbi:NUMOD4 domain-containing protein [Cytophagaceae bacterium YF14B1]|uniref:NUMOD4 domain-containing protein n=1 Tax=Xanthocytophaga flava TaxID=3048013 RepID=A0AAE3QZ13_9BACT|nr:NUMOD4 domain-containing protein [Xanthocytophaga flavus]MDJ1485364.1 NUMOD4 domain-containing protein [Xanthocytophaga flavus]